MTKRNFFGSEGLTSTSATHVAELCKNYYLDAEARLASVRFFNEQVSLLTSSVPPRTTKVGWNMDDIEGIPALLDKVIAAKSLCGWLREAVKEITRLYAEANKYEDVELRNRLKALELSPVTTKLTEEDVRQSWTIGEQETYIALETECVVIGRFIHENGPLHDAKATLLKVCSDPITLKGDGSNTIITERTPTLGVETINEIESSLQARHRSVQAQLNGMKHRIELAIKESEADVIAATRKLNEQKEALRDEINTTEAEVRQYLTGEVGKLRIVIPNNLREIYKIVTA